MTRTAWVLSGYADVMRCDILEMSASITLRLFMGDELILEELWPDATSAVTRAGELRGRLLSRGWLERD
jgi:hypothetical protein